MTAALVVAIYLLALAGFLGLDIFGKEIPPIGYARVAGALGALAGVALIAGMRMQAHTPETAWARDIAVALASAGAGGAIVSLWRRRGPPPKKVAR